jgi:hypothetical protein
MAVFAGDWGVHRGTVKSRFYLVAGAASIATHIMGRKPFPFIFITLSVVSVYVALLPDTKVVRGIEMAGNENGRYHKNDDKQWSPGMIPHWFRLLSLKQVRKRKACLQLYIRHIEVCQR